MRLILLIFSLILILQSCSTTKHVPKNKSLLVKNNVIIQNDYQQNFLVTKSDILNILRQKPNKKIFGFYPFHLNIYNLSDSLNKNWLHKYIRKIGEEPVLFNEELFFDFLYPSLIEFYEEYSGKYDHDANIRETIKKYESQYKIR